MTERYPLWVRFGITLDVSVDEANKIINDTGNEGKKVLAKVFAEGRAMFDGESYIPGICIEDFNRYSESHLNDADVELDTSLLDGKTIRPIQRKPPDRGDDR